jgi:beta-lactamase class A
MNPENGLAIASVGKVLLLIEAARQLEALEIAADEILSRRDVEWVGDSGLWQHLAIDELPLVDVATLAASVSDNLATNVLIDRIGLHRVDGTRKALGLSTTRMLDRIRDPRGPGDPPSFASGSAEELCAVFDRLHSESIVSPEVSRRVAAWLSTNVDLSMVAAGFELDPLAHASGTAEPSVVNKTGNDANVRADCGYAVFPARTIAWAVIINWEPTGRVDIARIHRAMRAVGESIVMAGRADTITGQPVAG